MAAFEADSVATIAASAASALRRYNSQERLDFSPGYAMVRGVQEESITNSVDG
jgi:hypothetical protein